VLEQMVRRLDEGQPIAGEQEHGQEWRAMEARLRPLAKRHHLLQFELRTAEQSIPTHPLIATTKQATETGLRYVLTQMVAADVDRIAISPGQVLIDRGEGAGADQQAGMHAVYDPDGSLPKALRNLLKSYDPSIEMTVEPLRSSVDG